MVNKAWVSEAMDLYARAMLTFDRRDRNMAFARQGRRDLQWWPDRVAEKRKRVQGAVKLARMCHKTGMRLMRQAQVAQGLSNTYANRYRFMRGEHAMTRLGLDPYALPWGVELDAAIDQNMGEDE